MKPAPPPFSHVVIMGDLVGSEDAPDRERLHAVFNAAVAAANKKYRSTLASPLTITLGDEFQGLAKSFSAAMAIIREMRFTLRRDEVACRFVLGAVSIETPLNAKKAWNMMGAGLSQTRDALADKKDPNAYRFVIAQEALIEALMNAVGLSITEIENRWTDRQFEIAALDLGSETSVDKLAAKLGISARVFYKIRKAAELDYYVRQWSALTLAADALDDQFGFHP